MLIDRPAQNPFLCPYAAKSIVGLLKFSISTLLHVLAAVLLLFAQNARDIKLTPVLPLPRSFCSSNPFGAPRFYPRLPDPYTPGRIYTVTQPRMTSSGLSNSSALDQVDSSGAKSACKLRSLAIQEAEDDQEILRKYRPFLLPQEIQDIDWISRVELSTVLDLSEADLKSTGDRAKVLVLYGSLRACSFSRLLAFEACRILFRLGCDVRVFDPLHLPVKNDVQHTHPKVEELRELSRWSDGHVWVSPEQHGNLTAVFKNQIDWIPLSRGSVRPTQGRTLAIAQVSGGSQSFNTLNSLRLLGRWMRMFTIPNQSSVPKAYTQFTDEHGLEGGNRMIPSENRDRLVDCMEEFVKYTIIMRPHLTLFGDRYSERMAKVKSERNSLDDGRKINGIDIGAV